MKYQSNALWPAGVCSSVYCDNISTDHHPSSRHAEAVCAALEREGFGGERKHFPLRTWVSDVQQPPKLPVCEYCEGTGIDPESFRSPLGLACPTCKPSND